MRARFAPIVGMLGLSVAACEPRTTSPASGGARPAFQTVDFVNETHFRCYTVSQQTPQPATTATLSDQFISSATLSIDEPLQFCAPTSKNGGPINAPEEHLTMVNARRTEPTFQEAPVAYAASSAVDDDLPLKVGAHVRHARFGEGLVVGVEREGDDVMVTVRFASVGRKRLSMQYAHLEELD